MSDTKQKTTEGKIIGKRAFYVSEFIVILAIIAVIVNIFFEKRIDGTLIMQILLYQGTIFGIVWGAKASSNFAKKDKKDE